MWYLVPIVLGVVALGCGNSDELAPLNFGEDEDAGKDAKSEDAATDSKADVQPDAGSDVATDGGVDAKPDVSTDSGHDAEAGSDAPEDSPFDVPFDNYVEADVLPPAHYTCRLLATDKFGVKYAMYLGSSQDVSPSSSGFTVPMHFEATTGTPQTLEDSRTNEAAGNWPKDGQTVSLGSLTGRYEVEIVDEGSGHSVSIRGFDVSIQQYVNASIFPMTYADVNGNPLPIEPDTSNEIYLEFSPHVSIGVNCDTDCTSLSGSKDVNAESGGEFSEIAINCSQ